MRTFVSLLCCLVAGLAWSGCTDDAIGQPCTFNWPTDTAGAIDCTEYPACAPVQNTAQGMGSAPRNDACPVDCIQIPSLECINLICVATQVDGDNDHINGQCGTDVVRTECTGAGEAAFGCKGYCSKECLSDASCPKGYRCSPMAPFGETLRCDNEDDWGTTCTDDCVKAGEVAETGVTCPASTSTGGEPPSYEECNSKDYSKCCACICYQFCPLLTKKFCRKIDWDDGQFPDGITTASGCSSD